MLLNLTELCRYKFYVLFKYKLNKTRQTSLMADEGEEICYYKDVASAGARANCI